MTEPIGVAIVDDHPLFRDGLARAVSTAPGLELVGAVPAIAGLDRLERPPEVVLLDLHLPGVNGSEGVARVVAAGYRVLVVTGSEDGEAVVDALGAGAAGYVTKDVEAADLVAAVRVIADGGTYVSPTLAAYLLRAGRTPDPLALTARELEVLELVADGDTDREIAALLCISVATVRSHLDRIRNKTGARRRVQLAALSADARRHQR